MRAKYKTAARCQSCIDLGWFTAEACAYCEAERTHTVDVLQLGVGCFGNKAIVKDVNTGKLDTVFLSDLTIIKEEDDE